MPIFLNGKEYEDEAHVEAAYSPMLKDMGVDVQPIPPADVKGDEKMVVTPEQADTNKQLQQQDDAVLGGTEVTNRIYVGRTPLQASTEPSGALNQESGTLVATPEQKLSAAFLERLSGTPNPRTPGEVVKDWVTKTLTSAYEALKLPGDAWQGKVDPMSEEGRQKALDLAGMMVFGPAPVAKGMADGTLGSFAGVKSKTFNKNDLAMAQIMEKHGKDVDTIFQETGMFRGIDNKWRYEIPDQDAKINMDALQYPSMKKYEEFEQVPFDFHGGAKQAKLSDFYDHPQLYKAYPHLKDITVVERDTLPGGAYANYNPETKTLNISKEGMKDSPYTLKELITHEIQHEIQAVEGFPKGGAAALIDPSGKGTDVYKPTFMLSPSQITDIKQNILKIMGKKNVTFEDLDQVTHLRNILDTHEKYIQAANTEAASNYWKLAGEVEARNVQSRDRFLTKEQAAKTHPRFSEDVPVDNQIVVDLPSWTTPYGALSDGRYVKAAAPDANPSIVGSANKVFETHSQRWANNDNARPLNEHEQFIKDYDELHKLGQTLGTPVKDKRFGELRKWSDLDYQKYNKAGREFAKKHGQTWEDVKPTE